MRATLVDLAGTVSRGDGPFDDGRSSFFDPLPAGADLYVLRSVLNDWPDADDRRVLRNAGAAMRRSSWLIVSGGVARRQCSPAVDDRNGTWSAGAPTRWQRSGSARRGPGSKSSARQQADGVYVSSSGGA